MLESFLPKIRNMFVGREKELITLRGYWELACQEREHLLHVLLNAPGVGKTTLLEFFGRELEEKELGLHINVSCTAEYETMDDLNRFMIYLVKNTLRSKKDLLERYIQSLKVNEEIKESYREQLQEIREEVNKKDDGSITLNSLIFFFQRLADVIPIMLVADEIQEFQFLKFPLKEESWETALHYYTRLLKGLLHSRILIILSGTRYHVMSQIGFKIGSPIRHKVHSLVLSNFTLNELEEYVAQVEKIIETEGISVERKDFNVTLDSFKWFLNVFSGGHPRTVEKLTELFLSNIEVILTTSQGMSNETLMDLLLDKSRDYFASELLSTDYKAKITEMASIEAFSIIKEWLLVQGSKGLSLGKRPNSTDSMTDDIFKEIVYDLMNIGIITQNGSDNYYLTSYFHFLEFLKVYHDPHEEFLKQVLTNRYFKLMCGSHSGLGYTFENIFTATLFIKSKKTSSMPVNPSQLRTIQTIAGNIDISELELEPNIFYQTPAAEAIDGMLLQENELILIQITTARNPDPAKLSSLIDKVDDLKKIKLKNDGISIIKGWMVSLYAFKRRPELPGEFFISEGEGLEGLLGKELVSRLKHVKEVFTS